MQDLDIQGEKVCIWYSRKSGAYIWGFGKESILDQGEYDLWQIWE